MTDKLFNHRGSSPAILSSLFDDLTNTMDMVLDGVPVPGNSYGGAYVDSAGTSWDYHDGGNGNRVTGTTAIMPHNWDPSRHEQFDEFPSTIEEWMRKFRDMGLGTDVFERAKEVYKSLPKFPATDIAVDRNTGDLEVKVALPGYEEDDIDVSFENDTLSIVVDKDNALSREKEAHEGEKVYLRRSLTTSKVSLQLPVPFTRFRVKDAKADYTQGMLHIIIPRNEEHAPHRLKLGKGKEE